MRRLSGLSRIGAAGFRPASIPSANVCVFCLQGTRQPFSTSTPRNVDVKRKRRKEQTERQKRYEARNEIGLTPEQLAPRLRHQTEVEWGRILKEAKRTGQEIPDKGQWLSRKEKQEKREKRGYGQHPTRDELDVRAREAQALEVWQESFDVAVDQVEEPRPATWDGMEIVGGETEWNTGLIFESHLPKKKLSSNPEVTIAMYRAVIEVLTAMAHGMSLAEIEKPKEIRGSIYNDISDVRIKRADGENPEAEQMVIILEYPSEEVENRIYRSVKPLADGEAPEAEAGEESSKVKLLAKKNEAALKEQIDAWGKDWLRTSITDPEIKFAMIKRLTALLGKPVPDPLIHAHHTIGSLLRDLAKPPPAKKLHSALATSDTLRSLPNLTLRNKKDTVVDDETSVGRWKVIRNELRRRDLPVLPGVSGWEHEELAQQREARDVA